MTVYKNSMRSTETLSVYKNSMISIGNLSVYKNDPNLNLTYSALLRYSNPVQEIVYTTNMTISQ